MSPIHVLDQNNWLDGNLKARDTQFPVISCIFIFLVKRWEQAYTEINEAQKTS
jgi:hypothetical protein